jgi:hypothetical protein
VPTISRFFGISIAMFFDDHGYPHFHARHAGKEAKVRIDNREVVESTLGRRQLRLAWPGPSFTGRSEPSGSGYDPVLSR